MKHPVKYFDQKPTRVYIYPEQKRVFKAPGNPRRESGKVEEEEESEQKTSEVCIKTHYLSTIVMCVLVTEEFVRAVPGTSQELNKYFWMNELL